MGGNSSSNPQGMGSPLSGMFMGNTGFQGSQVQLPTIQAPQYGPMLNPSPQQAAASTVARMQARTPMAAPVAAPTVPEFITVRNGRDTADVQRPNPEYKGSGGKW